MGLMLFGRQAQPELITKFLIYFRKTCGCQVSLCARLFCSLDYKSQRHVPLACDKENVTSNSSECGPKEKSSAYLDIALNLISETRNNFSATCDEGEVVIEDRVKLLHLRPMDCAEVLENENNSASGVYTVWPRNRVMAGEPVDVYCDMDTDGGGWTVIQRRGNYSQKVDFYRNWESYKNGFGNLTEEFWIGNDVISAMSNQGDYVLRFDLQSLEGEYRHAKYDSFYIDDEDSQYMLHLGQYNGTAGDGISTSNGILFSTKDRYNGEGRSGQCTEEKHGGWWYKFCSFSNPNGVNQPKAKEDKKSMNWYPWFKYEPLLKIEMKIRAL
ncbi:techylectin-5B [Caerostris extrusa]|uniref:Techylectin-5B n=1 Tax=Caerostris extrusa TaxID=172846 RepID=A0AAV4ULU4_CAEEX|nr:techylectin-5B [Caerostris extrusa]